MQVANITLALGGDHGQTIQKFNVTPSEVAVLRLLHGSDAVSDVVVVGDVTRTHRSERERLVIAYGRGLEGEIRCPAVDALFPGLAARMFESFDELGEDFGDETPEDEVFTPAPVPVELPKPAKKGRKKAVEPEEPSAALGE